MMATNLMSVVKYCNLHDTSYTNWCPACVTESYRGLWNAAAQEIQDKIVQTDFGWTCLEDIIPYMMKGEAVKAFMAEANQEDSFEIALRRLRIREHVAIHLKAWITNPDNDRSIK